MEQEIIARLDTIFDPCSVASGDRLGLSEMGLIAGVDIDAKGAVTIDLRLTSPSCLMIGFLTTQIEQALRAVEGVSAVQVRHDAGERWDPEMMSEPVRRRREERFRQLAEKHGASLGA